jgi:hypothetical protein
LPITIFLDESVGENDEVIPARQADRLATAWVVITLSLTLGFLDVGATGAVSVSGSSQSVSISSSSSIIAAFPFPPLPQACKHPESFLPRRY